MKIIKRENMIIAIDRMLHHNVPINILHNKYDIMMDDNFGFMNNIGHCIIY